HSHARAARRHCWACWRRSSPSWPSATRWSAIRAALIFGALTLALAIDGRALRSHRETQYRETPCESRRTGADRRRKRSIPRAMDDVQLILARDRAVQHIELVNVLF
ncbi:MAG: hypothetical protein ABR591_15725, partial [Candidatus Velthaea sp.]